GIPEEGTIWFDATETDFVTVEFTSSEGVTYSEEVELTGREKANVKIALGDLTGFTPKAKFEGLYSLDGKKIPGLKRGETGILQFKIDFAEGELKHLFHARIGSDDEVYADSMDEGITGYQAAGTTAFFGRTYNIGNMSEDYANEGTPNEESKFLELEFNSGGTKTIKVKVNAKEIGFSNSFEMHYRAETVIGARHLRDPLDNELNEQERTEEKQSLYAETYSEKIMVYSASSECAGNLCAAFKFIDEDGKEFNYNEFKAVKGKTYSLITEFNPMETKYAKIKATTDKTNPLLSFTSTDAGNSPIANNSETMKTEIETPQIPLKENESTSSRIFFETRKTGDTKINVQVLSEKDVLNKEFVFSIEEEKELEFTALPEPLVFGKDFEIKTESIEGEEINNAEIKIYSEKELIKTIAGNDSIGKGKNGLYSVKNSFDSETIEIEVKAEGYYSKKKEFEITREGMLLLPKEITVIIPSDSKQKKDSFIIENLSGETIQDLEIQLIKPKNYPNDIKLSFGGLIAIYPNSSQKAELIAEYTGSNESESAQAELVVKGKIRGKYFVSAKTEINIQFNPQIDPSCLEFSTEKLAVFFATSNLERENYANSGIYNPMPSQEVPNAFAENTNENYYQGYESTGTYYNNPYSGEFYGATTDSKEIELTVKNNCTHSIHLKPQIVPLSTGTDQITIEAEEIELGSSTGSESQQTIKIKVTNGLMRNYEQKKTFKFNILFKSSPAAAVLPLEVIFWDAQYALLVNRTIDIYLTSKSGGENIPATFPLFIKNIGEEDVTDLKLSILAQYTQNATQISVYPNSFPIIKKNQTLMPAPALSIRAIRDEKASIANLSQVKLTGRINGKIIDFGPIYVTAHVSPEKCLKLKGTNIIFEEESLSKSITKNITIRNECVEEVRIREIYPNLFGSNSLLFTPTDLTLMPNESKELTLILNINEEWNTEQMGSQTQLIFRGYLARSNSWIESNPLNITIKLGKAAYSDSKASFKKEIPICDSQEKKEIYLPEISSGGNCNEKYCDASLLAEYLVKKIQDKINDAKTKALRYGNDAQKAGCDTADSQRGLCKFDYLIDTEQFNVYLMHDNVTAELLQEKMQNTSISNFRVTNYSGIDIQNEVRSNQIFLADNFKGCGIYSVKIDGDIGARDNKLMPEYIRVELQFMNTDKRKTNQCAPEIQNIMNFLPKDKGISVDSEQGTWLATIQSESEQLNETGKPLAIELLDSENRFTESGAGNNLILKTGQTYSKLMVLRIEKNISETSPAEIEAIILNQENATEETNKKIAGEAAGVLKSIANGSFKKGICITEDRKEIRADMQNKFAEKLELKADKPLFAMIGKEYCTDFTIESMRKDTVKLTIKKSEDEIKGIDNLIIRNEKMEKINEKEIELTESKEKDSKGKFTAKLKACGTGTQEFFELKERDKITITADSTLQQKNETEIQLKACAMHPEEVMKKALEESKKDELQDEYFTVLYWEGEPNLIPLKTIELSTLFERNLEAAGGKLSDKAEEKIQKDPYPELRRNAVGWGATACVGTSALINIPRHGMFAIADLVFDCGEYLPKFMATTETGSKALEAIRPWIIKAKEFMSGIWDSLKEFPVIKQVRGVFDAIKGAGKSLLDFFVEEPTEEDELIIDEGIDQGTMKAMITKYYPRISKLNGGIDALATQASKEMEMNLRKNLTASEAKKFRLAFQEQLSKRLKVLKTSPDFLTKGRQFTQTALENAINEAIGETATSFDLKAESFLLTNSKKAFTKEIKTAAETMSKKVLEAEIIVLKDSIADTVDAAILAKKDEIATRIANSIKGNIDTRLGGAAGIDSEIGSLKESIKSRIDTVITPSSTHPTTGVVTAGKTELALSAEAAESIRKKFTAELGTALTKDGSTALGLTTAKYGKEATEKTIQKLAAEATEKTAAISRRRSLSNMLRRAGQTISRPGAFGFDILKGVGNFLKEGIFGAVPSITGNFIEKKRYDSLVAKTDPTAKTEGTATTKEKNTFLDENEKEFVSIVSTNNGNAIKGTLYSFKLGKEITGDKKVNIDFFNGNLADGTTLVPEKELPKNLKPEQLWIVCDGSYKKPLTVTDFIPWVKSKTENVDGRGSHLKMLYIKKINKIPLITLITDAARKRNIPPALVVTAGIMETGFGYPEEKNNLFGCNAETGIEESLACAVDRLYEKMNSSECAEGEENLLTKNEIECVLKAYDSDGISYNQKFTEEFFEWQAFDKSGLWKVQAS
ncbi:MAG: hypothetical protein ABIA76_05930, partial [Candidatus Diapherotrites archaeon]